MHFINRLLQEYIENHTEDEPTILADLRRETHIKVMQPRMLTGHYMGRVLSFLSKLISPKCIVEIGTFTGYSALCLAEGLQADGQLHTFEINEELAEIQNKYFELSGKRDCITQHFGDANQVLENIEPSFDLVFIDGDKLEYDAYFETCLSKCKSGSLIISDNILWSGKVVGNIDPKDIHTQSILKYNQKLKDDPRVDHLILPLRDGISICRVL